MQKVVVPLPSRGLVWYNIEKQQYFIIVCKVTAEQANSINIGWLARSSSNRKPRSNNRSPEALAGSGHVMSELVSKPEAT